MEFSIILYETAKGHLPLRHILQELKVSDPDDHAVIVAGLAKRRDRANHREPLSKPLADGLFELRHVGKLNTRVLYFSRGGRPIVAVHIIRNKGRSIPARDLKTARDRMRDWIERNSDD